MIINRRDIGDGIILIGMIGRLDLLGRVDLLQASEITDDQKLIIDLSLLTYITLEGVQVLANIAIEKGVAKPNVFFIEPQEEQVREKIDAVGMNQYLTVFPTIEDALAKLRLP